MYLGIIVDFSQPLLARKNELDKLRKDLKEQWQREQKKMVRNTDALYEILVIRLYLPVFLFCIAQNAAFHQ